MKRNQFTFYRSFYEAVKRLPKGKRAAVVMAIVEYGLDLVEPTGLNNTQYGFFLLTKPVLDAAWKKAKVGSTGGKISRRGSAEKISKGEVEKDKEIEDETETKGEGFPEFWERYPLKVAMEAAREEYLRVCEDKNLILSGLEAWRHSRQWALEEGRFVPRADKWLRERWWEQTPPGYIPKGASGILGKDEIDAINRMMEGERS